jgi:Tfp pilus assembly protein PilO
MKSTNKIALQFVRFEMIATVIIIAMILCIVSIHGPYTHRLVNEGMRLREYWEFKQNEHSFLKRKTKIQQDIQLIDSLIKIQEHKNWSDDKSVLSALYQYADTAELKTSKVQIGERIKKNDHFETAVMVRGVGGYSSIGHFCEAIENMSVPIRIRNITLGSADGGKIEAVFDFVVLAEL